MKAAIVIAPKDFRDETVSKARMMFQKWGVTPVIVGLVPRECTGSHGAVYKPDINIAKVSVNEFDVLFLVDGDGVDAYKLYDVMPLLDLVRAFNSSGRIVAGVNNGVKMIARSNIITGKKVSIPKEAEIDRLVKLYKGVVSQEEMECGTNVMTLRDYTRTEEFVGAILDRLGAR
ncbi:MAG TPA: DJ-1/PfpI family protein [Candidatus Saccharimonadales bacterium]|nr:DJ-1/PfpI family protein [Candidatus Saccharimonadales bacterium]